MTTATSTSPPGSAVEQGSWRVSVWRGVVMTMPTVGVVGLLVALAAHRYLPLANADAMLPALISTQHLTLFYWGQDRLASVVPAMAWPVRDPIWNFRVQTVIAGFAFFGLLAMFAWFHLHATGRRVTASFLAMTTLVTGILVMMPMRAATGNVFIFEQGYAFSLALFLSGGRWVMRPYSPQALTFYVAGAAAIVASLLVNPSLALLAPMLWILDDTREGRMRRSAAGIGVVIVGFALGAVAARLFYDGPSQQSMYNDFSVARARHGLGAVVSGLLGSLDLSVATVLGVGCITVLALRWQSLPWRLKVVYVVAPVIGFTWILAFSANRWVEFNLFGFRYFYTVYAAGMLWLAGAVAEAGALARNRLPAHSSGMGTKRSIGVVLGVVLAGVGVAAPLYATAHTDIPTLEATDQHVAAARRFKARLVVGDYWSTWPIVVAGRGDGLDLLGVTFRSVAIEHQIRDSVDDSLARTGHVRLLCPSAEPTACARDFAAFIGRDWAFQPVSTDGPVVIDVHPIAEAALRGLGPKRDATFSTCNPTGRSPERRTNPGSNPTGRSSTTSRSAIWLSSGSTTFPPTTAISPKFGGVTGCSTSRTPNKSSNA